MIRRERVMKESGEREREIIINCYKKRSRKEKSHGSGKTQHWCRYCGHKSKNVRVN